MAYKCTNLNPYPVVVRGKTIQPNGYDVVDVIPTLTSEQKAKLVFTLVNDPSVDDASAALESSSGLSSSPTSNTAIAAAALAGQATVNASRTTSHYLEASERLEFDLDSTQTNIAVIIDNSDTATSIGSDASGANGFTGLITRLAIRTSAANDADLTLASAGGK